MSRRWSEGTLNSTSTHPGAPRLSPLPPPHTKIHRKQRAAKAAAALDPATTCTLVLVRHGETTWNVEGRLQGQQLPGPSLSERGKEQARAMAQALSSVGGMSACYCSDLARAVETAEAIAAAAATAPSPLLEVRQLPALRERDVGRLLEGVRRADAAQAAPQAFDALRRSAREPSLELPGGGESINALAARVGAALLGIARAHPGERVVVVSHGGAIHAARRFAEGLGGSSSAAAASPLPNGALCELRCDPGQVQEDEEQEGQRPLRRAPGGQWRKGWAVVRWADCSLLGDAVGGGGSGGGLAVTAGTAGGGVEAG